MPMLKTREAVLAVVKQWLEDTSKYDGPIELNISMIAAYGSTDALYGITETRGIGSALLERQLSPSVTPKPRSITVNGKQLVWDKTEMTYEALLELVDGRVGWTATYDRGPYGEHGTLYVGKTVQVVDGMDFDCIHTGSA